MTGTASHDPIDEAVLEHLRELGGDEDPGFLPGLLTEFVVHAEAAIRELRAAHSRGSRAEIRAQAHVLKGSAGNVGARELASIASRIQRAADDPSADLALDIAALAAEFARVRDHLAARSGRR